MVCSAACGMGMKYPASKSAVFIPRALLIPLRVLMGSATLWSK